MFKSFQLLCFVSWLPHSSSVGRFRVVNNEMRKCSDEELTNLNVSQCKKWRVERKKNAKNVQNDCFSAEHQFHCFARIYSMIRVLTESFAALR